MAFQQESELLECFNHHFIKMIQSGVMGQINLRAETINEKFNSIDDAVTLSYMNVAFPSLILLGGVLISVFQLLIEQDWASILRFSGGVGGRAKTRGPSSLGSFSAGSSASGERLKIGTRAPIFSSLGLNLARKFGSLFGQQCRRALYCKNVKLLGNTYQRLTRPQLEFQWQPLKFLCGALQNGSIKSLHDKHRDFNNDIWPRHYLEIHTN